MDDDERNPKSARPWWLDVPELLAAELLALEPASLVPVIRDVTASALTVTVAVPRIVELRPQLAALLGDRAVACIDRLPAVARAALLVDAAFRATERTVDVAALTRSLTEARTVLRREAEALVARGVVHPRALASMSRRYSLNNVCQDVVQLTALLDGHCVPGGACALERAVLSQAEATMDALILAVRQRDKPVPSPIAELRARAFTLLCTTYEEVRRLVSFVRWYEGDADAIAPSLWASRRAGSRRRRRGSGD